MAAAIVTFFILMPLKTPQPHANAIAAVAVVIDLAIAVFAALQRLGSRLLVRGIELVLMGLPNTPDHMNKGTTAP